MKLGQKQPRNCPQHFLFNAARDALSRVRVSHAYASLDISLAKRRHQPRVRIVCLLHQSRVRVAHACASLPDSQNLNFLCSFYFCMLLFHPLSYSCPGNLKSLNTHITASNGNKRGLKLANLRPKKHVFNHSTILGRKI